MKHAQGNDRVDSWDPHVRFPIMVEGVKVCDYEVDFVVRYADGRRELVEIKSPPTRTAVWKLKVKLFQATFLRYNPEIAYRVVS